MVTNKNTRWAELRADIPALKQYTYLNTGFAPPPSQAMTDATQVRLDFELAHGSTTRLAMDAAQEAKEHLRKLFAQVLRAEPSEVALTASTGVGVSIVLAGLALNSGDRIITTSIEHGSGIVPLYHAGRISELEVEFLPVGPDDSHGVIAERFASAIDDRTSVVMISEISFATGQLLPVRAITEAAHRVGAIVVIDGAQTAGHIPIDVHALGVDAYAIPAQKWLAGPRGIGALYVSSEALPRIEASIVDVTHAEEWDSAGTFAPKADVPGKFELAAVPPVLVAGAIQAVESYLESGPVAVFDRICELTRFAEERFDRIEGVTIASARTDEARTGLFCFGVDGIDSPDLAPWLQREHGLVCRAVRDQNVTRLSFHVFNTEDDVERAALGVEQAIRDGVPPAAS